MKSVVVSVCLGIGIVMFVLSMFWVQMFPGKSSWSPEKAELWGKTKDRLHNLSFIVNSNQPSGRVTDIEAARQEYQQVKATHERLKAEFESAYNAPRTTAKVLKWGGLVLSGVGLLIQFGWKQEEN